MTRTKAEGNQPISRHPLFPAIVALWFGALFGLVSLAIKPEIIEQVVVASGIDSLLPMAAPPLGTTMRILLALAMTGLGGVTGLLIARRIARPGPEAGEGNRRRASRAENNGLAIAGPRREEETALSAFAVVPARKPPREAAILNVSEFDLGGYDERAAEPATASAAPFAEAEPGPGSNNLFDAYSREFVARPDLEATEAYRESPGDEPARDIPVGPAGGRHSAAARIASAELDTLSQVELLERLALAMAQCRRAVAPAAAAARLEVLADAASPHARPETEGEPDLDGWPETEPSPPSAPVSRQFGGLHEIAPAAASREDAPASPEIGPEPLRVPPALRPVGYDLPDEDDALPGYVPPRRIALSDDDSSVAFALPEPFACNDGEEAEEDVLEEGYSSLLDLSRSSPARQRFAGADEWEAVAEDEDAAFEEHAGPAPAEGGRPFDAPGRAEPEDTEKALRAALATLQRMSGAA